MRFFLALLFCLPLSACGFVGGELPCRGDSNCPDDSVCCDGTCRASCEAACGNGVVEAGESCDDGSRNADDGLCKTDCTEEVCGDGIVGPSEVCDDGNNVEDDSCTSNCILASCGNGQVDAGEDCDLGAANSDAPDAACRSNCLSPRCGDGIVDSGEVCDDGPRNGMPGNSCLADCTNLCGNGAIDSGEQCDEGAANSDAPDASCRTTCLTGGCGDGIVDSDEVCDNGSDNADDGLCKTDCTPETCGDGFVGPNEACDDGNTNDTDDCSNDCRLTTCGNGQLDPGEECDNGAANSDTEPNACRGSCLFPRCGDGVIDAGEACDDADLNDNDACISCVEATCGDGIVWTGVEECDNGAANSDTEPDACRTDCRTAYCGDGVRDSGEQCDDGNLIDTDYCPTACESQPIEPIRAPFAGEDSTTWNAVRFAPYSDTLFAMSSKSVFFRSDDLGQSWTRLCFLENGDSGYDTRIYVGATPDDPVYAVNRNKSYRVIASNGLCPSIGALHTNFHASPLTIATNGDVYRWDNETTFGTFMRSTDGGLSFSAIPHPIYDYATSSLRYATLATIPGTRERIIISVNNVGTYLYFPDDRTFLQVSENHYRGIKADPRANGYVYAAGSVSTDYGENWWPNSAYNLPNFWGLSLGGVGYRLTSSGGNLVLESASDMASPEWVSIYQTSGNETFYRVDTNSAGDSVVALIRGAIFLRAGADGTFEPVANVGEPYAPATLETTDGSNLYASTEGWNLQASSDGGMSWIEGFDTLRPSPDPARIVVHPAAPNRVFIYPDANNSTYDSTLAVSEDGLATGTVSSNGISSWKVISAVSITDPLVHYQFGGKVAKSTDGAQSFTTIQNNFPFFVWYPAAAVVHPGNSNLVYFVTEGSLYLYDATVRENSDVTSRAQSALGGDLVAGIEAYAIDTTARALRVISESGRVAISTDDGLTFNPANSNGPLGSGTCPNNRRHLVSNPANRDILVTACFFRNEGAAWSGDGGTSWVGLSAQPLWTALDCSVRSVTSVSSGAIFSCTNRGPVFVSYGTSSCGDGVAELPEFCDLGAANSNNPDAQCRPDCSPQRCGDGVQDSGEECDDGNHVDGDGCTKSCTVCGNGSVDGTELCDDGAGNSDMDGATCRTDCRPARCGDGVLSSPEEVCDDGNTIGGDGCRADCLGLEACGDGIIDPAGGEGCDDGQLNQDAPDMCRSSCVGPSCGDGIQDSGEECDDGNQDFGDSCTPFCTLDVAAEANCDDQDDDHDYVFDEGCGLVPPTSPPTSWVAYSFAYYGAAGVGCAGTRYVKASDRPEAPWLGAILCEGQLTYKLMLADAVDGVFYSLSDTSGFGEDHCDLVGGTSVPLSSYRTQSIPGYRRAEAGEAFTFATISNTQSSYDCGVTIP